MKVKHPSIADLVIEIEKERAAEYLAAGWLEVNKRSTKVTDVANASTED